jgi:prepilin-type N-terminal cleavage/methylation domain-containing protein
MINKKGFTLLEFILVIGIIAISAGVTLTISPNVNNKTQFNKTISAVTANVRAQRAISLSGYQGGFAGVHFDSDQYVIFPGSFYFPGVWGEIIYPLSGDFEFINIDLNGGSDIIFEPPNGNNMHPGTLQLRSDSLNITKTITIDSLGFISAQ